MVSDKAWKLGAGRTAAKMGPESWDQEMINVKITCTDSQTDTNSFHLFLNDEVTDATPHHNVSQFFLDCLRNYLLFVA